MQNLKLVLSTFIAVSALVSCNSSNTNKGVVPEIKNNSTVIFTSGTWHVSNFVKDGIDKKESYAAYVFEFMPNHHVTAKRGDIIYKGSWEIINDGITDDAPVTDLDLILDFKRQANVSQLNGEWMIEEKAPLKVELNNISSDHNKVDHLAFQKS
ncbi:hypothetical protein [Flavobacterium cerinum]|uniref:Lipocalin-like domain-containing protein n=1 Tax=Flavobacterium cerinum TaxID=2502784 RepID=A0A3S3TTC0_9FLAO|nr:hypothetical protein [Flavobacterium cerinum]RWW92357.1 hypothetical protein EPI11_15720 [Flavobacterium cerinum]